MATIGWILILLAFTTAHGAIKGRTPVDLWGDLRDMGIALVSLDTKGVQEVYSRSGTGNDVTTPSVAESSGPAKLGVSAGGSAPSVAALAGVASPAAGAMLSVSGMPGRTGNPRADIVALGNWLKSGGFEGRKIRVGEHPSFGGTHPVHVPGSYHYKGLALDLNYDVGKQEPPVFDRLSKALVAKGWRVIWRAPGHVGHIHVDTGPAGFVRNPY